jgi:hypothetical protein
VDEATEADFDASLAGFVDGAAAGLAGVCAGGEQPSQALPPTTAKQAVMNFDPIRVAMPCRKRKNMLPTSFSLGDDRR